MNFFSAVSLIFNDSTAASITFNEVELLHSSPLTIFKITSDRRYQRETSIVTLSEKGKINIMQPDNEIRPKTKKPWWRRIDFEFYYFEKVGNRYYLRFTPLGLISIIVGVLLLFAYIGAVAWYESNKQTNT